MSQGTLTPDEGDGGRVLIGDTLVGFLEQVVKPEARQAIRASCVTVLDGALRAGPGSTGLVVGRVQSGKTLSYEGVISLARDNDFAVVIVISGISNPLLAQGERRLRNDLAEADPDGWLFLSPAEKQQSADHIERELTRVKANWMNATTPKAYRQTAVVVVLKNYTRIRDLAAAIARADLGDLRVLVVDDEADQASLNTLARRSRESPTYSNLLALRSSIPNHFYLQYTATPQAPLLIAIDDALSPDFVRVLAPGTGYTGGDTYFEERADLIEAIGESDLDAVNTPGGPPPETLRLAMQMFLVGAANSAVRNSRPETRSMLVHPSRETGAQGIFAGWINSMRETWHDRYEHAAEVEPLKLRAEFQTAWQKLHDADSSIATFEQCWDALGLVLRNLDVTEVNTRRGETPVINWVATKFYILIGGQAIDRGFTVEGLTTTYMPRGAGTLTADTIQQRARFFGYKASYLGLCRVFLEPEVRDAFERYVIHERHMLGTLHAIEAGTDSLKDWKRRFLLDASMRPTRASVIDIPMVRVRTADRWITDRLPVRDDAPSLEASVAKTEELLAAVRWREDAFGNRIGYTTARQALEILETVSPQSLLREPNSQALSLALARLDDEAADGPTVAVIWVRPNHLAKRTETKDGTVQIFEGQSSRYPGDRAIFEPTASLTLQLHKVRVESGDKTRRVRGESLIAAWRLPEASSTSWLVQEDV